MVDGLRPELEARAGGVLVVAVQHAREEDRREDEAKVAAELIAIDGDGAPVGWATSRLPLIGAVEVRREAFAATEEVVAIE